MRYPTVTASYELIGQTNMRTITDTGLVMLFVLIAVVLAVAGHAQTKKTNPAQFSSIEPDISFVEAGGYWEQRSRSGRYRVVVQTQCSPEHCYDRLYVQWLETKGPETKVVTTRYIKETGDLTNFKKVRFVLSKAGTSVEVESEPAGGEYRLHSCLRLRAPGDYSHAEGPCKKSK